MNAELIEARYHTEEAMKSILGRRIARLDLRHRLMTAFLSASRQLASGKIDELEAESLALRDVSAPMIALKQRTEERNREVKLLLSVKGIGPVLAGRLIDEFGTARSVSSATIDQLQVVPGIRRKTAEAIHRGLKMLSL